MGRKINIELPKYRLQMHIKLVKRRKPLLEEPIVPTRAVVNRKYHKGTLLSKFVRYATDHKKAKEVFAACFTLVTIGVAFIPQTNRVEAQGSENIVIESQTALKTEKTLVYPVDKVKVNQGFSIFHKATDFGGPLGTPVKPIMNGVVAYAGWDKSGYGNLVVLQHINGIDSYYAHLSKIEVVTGQLVNTETIIGKMGATGRSTGVHLHLEIHQNGVSLNPLTVLSK